MSCCFEIGIIVYQSELLFQMKGFPNGKYAFISVGVLSGIGLFIISTFVLQIFYLSPLFYVHLFSIMTTNTSDSDICCKCREEVRPLQEGLLCDDCKGWFHRICIPKGHTSYYSRKRYREIVKQGKSFAWLCHFCDRYVLPRNDANVSYQNTHVIISYSGLRQGTRGHIVICLNPLKLNTDVMHGYQRFKFTSNGIELCCT